MASLVVTSNAGGDGNIYNDNAGSWATVRALASGTAQPSSDPVNVYASMLTSRSIGRIFIPFDTSALGAGATVTAATLTINVTSILGSNSTLHIIQTTQADPTALANGDFGNVSYTSGGSVSVTSTGSKVITLNATGLTWLNTTGYSKLGIIEDHDQSNTDPNPSDYRFSVNMAENATSGNRPTLTITYTPATTTSTSSTTSTSTTSTSSSTSTSTSTSSSTSTSTTSTSSSTSTSTTTSSSTSTSTTSTSSSTSTSTTTSTSSSTSTTSTSSSTSTTTSTSTSTTQTLPYHFIIDDGGRSSDLGFVVDHGDFGKA